MLGVYEISLRTIEFETQISKDQIEVIFQKFQDAEKVIYSDGFVIIKNWVRHQSYNPNMLKSAQSTLEDLKPEILRAMPDSMKRELKLLQTKNHSEDKNKGFQRLSNTS